MKMTLTLDIVPNDQVNEHPYLLFIERSVQVEDREEVDVLLQAMDADVIINVYEGVSLEHLPKILTPEEITAASFKTGSFWSVTDQPTSIDIYP